MTTGFWPSKTLKKVKSKKISKKKLYVLVYNIKVLPPKLATRSNGVVRNPTYFSHFSYPPTNHIFQYPHLLFYAHHLTHTILLLRLSAVRIDYLSATKKLNCFGALHHKMTYFPSKVEVTFKIRNLFPTLSNKKNYYKLKLTCILYNKLKKFSRQLNMQCS